VNCQLLKVLSNKKNAEIIDWTPSGKAFEIRNPRRFVAEILPKEFKSAKYTSFTRKLHRWGFMRHYRGEEAGAFYHRQFIRGRLDLVEQMTCHTQEAPKVAASMQRKANVSAKAYAPAPRVRSVVQVNANQAPIRPVPIKPIVHAAAPQDAPPAVAHRSSFDLNAVIEFEVNRRLEDRINNAALKRQALVLMEKQQQQAKLSSLLEQRIIALAQQQSRFQSAGLSMPQVDLSQVYRKFKPATAAPRVAFSGRDGSGLLSLPATNIQGAKTA